MLWHFRDEPLKPTVALEYQFARRPRPTGIVYQIYSFVWMLILYIQYFWRNILYSFVIILFEDQRCMSHLWTRRWTVAIKIDRYRYRRWHARVLSSVTICSFWMHVLRFCPSACAVHLVGSSIRSGRLCWCSRSTWALRHAFGPPPRRSSRVCASASSFCSSRWSPTGPTCAPRCAPPPRTACLPITRCAAACALDSLMCMCISDFRCSDADV